MTRGTLQLAFLALALAHPALAARTTAFDVTATVTPSATFALEYSSQPLVITDADIRKGFVEVVMRSRVKMATPRQRTELRPTYVVDVSPRADLFKSFGFEGNGTAPAVAHDLDGTPSEGEFREFRYRFELVEHARPGRYEAPLSFTIEL